MANIGLVFSSPQITRTPQLLWVGRQKVIKSKVARGMAEVFLHIARKCATLEAPTTWSVRISKICFVVSIE
jgi:hypothetical protein